MCLQCGISNYFPLEDVTLEDTVGIEMKLVRSPVCAECGGQLALIGKSGDHPHYKLAE
jgi:hypothetical protein